MKNQDWWKTAFNETYLAAFNDEDSMRRGEEEVAFLIKTLNLKKGARILDFACGQGRHAVPFAQQGMNVTCADASAPLLRAAKQRALAEKVRISFIKTDIRSYRKASRYDAIVMLGNSFGYFSDKDNERVLSNVAASLKSGGWFALDLSNTAGMLRQRTVGECSRKIPGGTLVTRELNFDPKTFRSTVRWRILQKKKKVSFDGVLRLYTPPEIYHLLAERNMTVEKMYGSFTKEPYSLETRRCLIIARKKHKLS
jgi:2-polyprenyl-3-methyl-5-hydroxy-6-metoxy-1,4-benzoquinol methylase